MTEILGYRRKDGRMGLRNHLLIMPSVTCASHVAREISLQVPGSVSFENQYGCGQIGEDFQQTFRTLAGFGRNPNVGAVLVVGLGCELLRPEKLAKEVSLSQKPAEMLLIQETGGTEGAIRQGVKMARDLLEELNRAEPAPCSVKELLLGLECGGSDSTSGLAANPALGRAVDRLVREGARAILTEVPEIIGAEHLLAPRAARPELARRLINMVKDFEKEAVEKGMDIRGTQPTPGNIMGGLTTIEEKSLGCIFKAGTSPIMDVIQYGEPVKTPGITVMNGPGQDVQSITGMLAAGAQLIAFTTGRGTPAGCPIAPVIKITANRTAHVKMRDNIDVYVGNLLYGNSTLEEEGVRIYREILAVCRGKQTRSEILKHREFGIWRIAFTI